ncbi:MAG: hypothetical protein JOZ73_12375 [Solirubrobacterales bacterium]|nr:hypothetical protein [Solirubrobacterales bacterium]
MLELVGDEGLQGGVCAPAILLELASLRSALPGMAGASWTIPRSASAAARNRVVPSSARAAAPAQVAPTQIATSPVATLAPISSPARWRGASFAGLARSAQVTLSITGVVVLRGGAARRASASS